MKNSIIEVQNVKVNITNVNDKDYICISDFTKFKEGKSTSDDIIRNWLRNRITLECTECKNRNYESFKNKKNDPDRLTFNKFCPTCKKHTAHKESK